MPANDRNAPRSTHARANTVVAGEAVHHPALGRALLVDHAEHVVVGVAVVDDQRLVEPLGHRDVRAERAAPAPRGRPRRCGSGRGRSPRPRAPCRAPGQRLDLGERLVEGAGSAASRGASLGCRATPATSASYVAAASTAHRAPGRSQPICTILGTPTAAARARAASVASQSPSAMSRWQWLSTTGCGSGFGRRAAGPGRGRAPSPRPRSPAPARRSGRSAPGRV